MDFLSSPWVIISIIMCFLIGNVAAFRYFTPKNLDKFKSKSSQDLDRLIELDKKHQQILHENDNITAKKKDEH
jgi:hypothetical protein